MFRGWLPNVKSAPLVVRAGMASFSRGVVNRDNGWAARTFSPALLECCDGN
jgi:hypothetical protein